MFGYRDKDWEYLKKIYTDNNGFKDDPEGLERHLEENCSFFVFHIHIFPSLSHSFNMTEARKTDPKAALSVIKLLSNNNGNYLGSTERALNKTLYRHFPETQLRVP